LQNKDVSTNDNVSQAHDKQCPKLTLSVGTWDSPYASSRVDVGKVDVGKVDVGKVDVGKLQVDKELGDQSSQDNRVEILRIS